LERGGRRRKEGEERGRGRGEGGRRGEGFFERIRVLRELFEEKKKKKLEALPLAVSRQS
jgi:hypothetical protein